MGSFFNWLVAAVVVGLLTLGVLMAASRSDQVAAVVNAPPAGPDHDVRINLPRLSRPFIATGDGGQIPCSACHVGRTPDLQNVASADAGLDEFHQELECQHGDISCLSCHNADNYDTLRLADGRSLRFSDSMELCAQCHGPQFKDYENGAHGGMTGYWDLSRGPRERNTCVNCHDPHAPAFPVVRPAPGPRDRFASPADHDPDDAAEDPDHD